MLLHDSSTSRVERDNVTRAESKTKPAHKTRVFPAIVEMLRWFAGKQIRNAAAIGGNIITGSPISDLNPVFMAANCELELVSKGTKTHHVLVSTLCCSVYSRTERVTNLSSI